jgi:MFS family permease
MGMFSYLAPVVTDVAGLPTGAVPLVLTLYGAGSLVGVQLGGRLADAYPWATLYLSLGVLVLVLAAVAAASSAPRVLLAGAFVLGVAVFVAATPLNARVFALASPAPTLASASNASAFNVGNTIGPWLGGLVISAGFGFRMPSAVAAVLVGGAFGLGLLSRALDARVARRGAGERGDGLPHVAVLARSRARRAPAWGPRRPGAARTDAAASVRPAAGLCEPRGRCQGGGCGGGGGGVPWPVRGSEAFAVGAQLLGGLLGGEHRGELLHADRRAGGQCGVLPDLEQPLL